MKTLQELYKEVVSSEELKKEYIAAAKDGKALEFIKSHGVDASEDEIKTFFEELTKKDEELSPDELENAAGGGCSSETLQEAEISYFTAGVGCLVGAVFSVYREAAGNDGYGEEGYHVGQENPGDGRLCNDRKGTINGVVQDL